MISPSELHARLRSAWRQTPEAVPQEPEERRERQEEQLEEERLDASDVLEVSYARFVLRHSVVNFEAGSIAHCYQEWRKLTSDKQILTTVRGFRIDFLKLPKQKFKPYPVRMNKQDNSKLNEALIEFERCGIIERCPRKKAAFFSTHFITPKKDGSVRVICNLSRLNDFIEAPHFKMDTIKEAIYLMHEQCFFASIDFKSAYYSVNVDTRDRKDLAFEWQGRVYQYTVLPQGICTAPYKFTKLLKPAFAHLREKGIICLGYIDDTLFIANSQEAIEFAVSEAVALFDKLGLTIHPKKSVFEATHEIEYLGFILNSDNMTVRLTERKCDKIQQLAQQLLNKKHITIRQLSEFIGNVVAADPGVDDAPLFYKDLEILRNELLSLFRGDFDATFTLPQANRQSIQWWVDNVHCLSKHVVIPEPELVVESDASKKGWGGCTTWTSTGGAWTHMEALEHINVLELQAGFLTLQCFCDSISDKHIRLKMDNTTAVACINKRGSTKAHLFQLCQQIFAWAYERNVLLTAAYLPGRLNILADKESRVHNFDTEWMLQKEIFDDLCSKFGIPEIDLFATRINTQLPVYASWRPDPGSVAVDAFSLCWRNFYAYAFPPFSLIPRCLKKNREEGGTLLMVVPYWPTKAWFPMLQSHAQMMLPKNCLHLPQKPGRSHPLRKLQLVACLLCRRH